MRGFSAVWLLVDEASHVSDELYSAEREGRLKGGCSQDWLPHDWSSYLLDTALAVSGGAVWLMSTPFGKRGFFWEAWEHGGPDWKRVRVTAADCPRIPAAFLKEEKGNDGRTMVPAGILLRIRGGSERVVRPGFDRSGNQRGVCSFEDLRVWTRSPGYARAPSRTG